MKTLPLLLPLALLLQPAFAETKSPEADITAVFPELQALKSMPSRQVYTLPAHGEKLTGVGDDFLRRRTASEVAASGLSCGCGDYAVVFIDRMEASGYETLLIDSAQISSVSLVGHDAGHAIVAVRPKGDAGAPWWLVDSTARKILSRDWSPDAKSFSASGHVYWIGYCGPLDQYPVHDHEELKQFYARTLAAVPPEVFNRTLFRFEFTIDPSLEDGRGGYLNPRVVRLRAEQDELFARYRINPERRVAIRLARGGDDGSGNLRRVGEQWVAQVGLKSACSPSFLTYFEQRVRLDAADVLTAPPSGAKNTAAP